MKDEELDLNEVEEIKEPARDETEAVTVYDESGEPSGDEADVEAVSDESGESAGDETDVEDAAEDSDEPSETKEKARARKLKELRGDVIFFIVSFIVIYTIFRIFPPYHVSGNSMNNTLRNKAFGFGTIFFTPDYGDIIVLHGDGEKTNNDDFIKRVIGKPGDILDIIDGHVIRNGEELTEEYAYFDPNGILNGNNQHFELRDGEYFVMGDNRLHSSDSRYFGPIKRSEMKCKMLFFLWGKKR